MSAPGWARIAARAVGTLVLLVVLYAVWWHVAFGVLFLSRGDPLDAELYRAYLRYLFGPGGEIPSSLRVLAIALTVLTAAGLAVARASRARARRPGR